MICQWCHSHRCKHEIIKRPALRIICRLLVSYHRQNNNSPMLVADNTLRSSLHLFGCHQLMPHDFAVFEDLGKTYGLNWCGLGVVISKAMHFPIVQSPASQPCNLNGAHNVCPWPANQYHSHMSIVGLVIPTSQWKGDFIHCARLFPHGGSGPLSR